MSRPTLLSPYATLRRVRLPAPEPWSVARVVEDSIRILVQPVGLIVVCTLEFLVIGLVWRGLW